MKRIIFLLATFMVSMSIMIGNNAAKSGSTKYAPYIDKFDVDLDGINKVMIVAHPDDEMIFGGSELIDDDYLVVCITCGRDVERVREFKNVMSATNDKYIMLNYPDLTNGERDNWKLVYDDITNDISKILKLKDWDMIVTHNKNGEYGHIHHKMTHNIVTTLYEENYLDNDNLYFFGEYYNSNEIKNVKDKLEEISEDDYKKKNYIIYKYYVSQKFAADYFSHIFKYENLTKYGEE